jgi:hypothetical protein
MDANGGSRVEGGKTEVDVWGSMQRERNQYGRGGSWQVLEGEWGKRKESKE